VCRVRPGFVWDARVSLASLLSLRVRDSYVEGEGSGRITLLGFIPAGADNGGDELNSGALHRFLAEAVWYPTVLLPGPSLTWTAIDSTRSLATLTDAGITVSLEFRFNQSGEVTGIYSPGRWGRFHGKYRQVPWEGHFEDYRQQNGLLVPSRGEVGGTSMAPGRASGRAGFSGVGSNSKITAATEKPMASVTITRPQADESVAYYHRYIEKVTGEDITEQLIEQLHEVENLFEGVTDRAALARYAEGKWSIKEVIGHLIDTERIFGYRLLRIARGDATPLPGYDENAYVPKGDFDERPLAILLAEFRVVRQSTSALIEGLPTQAWKRRGVANGQPISTRALAYIMVGHVAHHLGVLRERYRLGP